MSDEIRFSLLFLAVLTANTGEALSGFGSTIIAITIGAHLYQMDFLLPVLVPLNLMMNTYILIRHHDAIVYHLYFRRILPLMLLGLPVGIFLFNYVNTVLLKAAFGIFVIAISLFELLHIYLAKKNPASAGKPGKTSGGLFQSAALLVPAGLFHGMFASGGPLLVYYAGRQALSKAQFRSTLTAVWAPLNIVLIASYLLTDTMTGQSVRMSLYLAPTLLLGAIFGEWLHHRISERAFRIFCYILLIIAGFTLLKPG